MAPIFIQVMTIPQLCEQFGLLHVSKGYGKERFIEVRKVQEDNTMAQAKSLPRDEAKSLPTDSSEARELDPIAHEEVLGMLLCGIGCYSITKYLQKIA